MVVLLDGVEDDGQLLIADFPVALNKEECTDVVDVAASYLPEVLPSFLFPIVFHNYSNMGIC